MNNNTFRVVLPNLRYKNNRVLFEYDYPFFGLNYTLVDMYDNIKNGSFKVLVNGDFYDQQNESVKHTNVYNIQYDIERIENNKGLICNIRYQDGIQLYQDDFRRIAKMTEMHIIRFHNVNNFDMNLLSKYLTK